MPCATLEAPLPPELQDRLLALWERTGDGALQRVARGEAPFADGPRPEPRQLRDWLGTCLMHVYARTRDSEAMALLHELHQQDFLRAIRGHLRHGTPAIDAHDVLQEALLNMLRYPQRFLPDRADAFRSWSHRIVRNTAMLFLRRRSAEPLPLGDDDESSELQDGRVRQPDVAASEHERAAIVDDAFCLFLGLYLRCFESLDARTRRLLTLVEVDGLQYRAVAQALGVDAPQIKVMVFRARQRLFRSMHNRLSELDACAQPECTASPEQ